MVGVGAVSPCALERSAGLKLSKDSLPERVSVDEQQMQAEEMADDDWTGGFGIPAGTLELVEVKRKQWKRPMQLPLPPPSPVEALILQEFVRPWKALRLPIPVASGENAKAGTDLLDLIVFDKKLKLPATLCHQAKDSLMKSYDPQYIPGEPTFASEIRTSSFLEPRVAVPEAQAFLVTPLNLMVMYFIARERIIPALCEFDFDPISSEELADAKFKAIEAHGQISPTPPSWKIADPFSEQNGQLSDKPESEGSQQYTLEQKGDMIVRCREVQPFCPPNLVPTFGIAGSGPVAVSYVNTLYVYPLQIEKCQYRNIAIRVQLLQKEADAVRGIEETDDAVLRSIYQANNQVGRSAYALVGYHQKNPQFEDEIKICLPEYLTTDHHLLFTFYHVHCKKLQPNQPQQELVGYAALPVIGKDGTIVQDGKYTMNVIPAPVSPKKSSTGGGISLSPGYVGAVRDGVLDNAKTVFSCRSRAISSVHSQDSAVAGFLKPFHGGRMPDSASKEDATVSRLIGLSQSDAPTVRYFFLMISKFVLGYLRYGASIVRWSAFRTLLVVMEKASWNPRGSLKIHEMDRVLHDFVHIIFDEDSIDNPNNSGSSPNASSKSERKSVFSALLETWLNVLNNKASIEENADTKRMSLTYSNVILQLILKSMAMTLLNERSIQKNDSTNSLPTLLAKNDEVMLERVLIHLVACAGDTSNGLLLQKEVNRSVAYFCRGIFLVVKNRFPARVIDRYVKRIDIQGDANSLLHVWFPFLHILVDFEFFPTVNGAVLPGQQCSVKAPAWLAKAIFDKLLLIVDTQKELKIRLEAVRLLRRMFTAQVCNPRFQSSDHQERIALLYYPLFPSIAQFTTQGRLLGENILSNSGISNSPGDAKSILTLQKEMLVCVGHLLCSVSSLYLPFFFRPFEENAKLDPVPLGYTEKLIFYHSVVSQISPHSIGMLEANQIIDNNRNDDDCTLQLMTATGNAVFDEAKVHARLELIKRMLEVFLVVEQPGSRVEPLWRQLLSPDVGASDNESGLSLLEHRLAHRRSFHRRAGGGLESSAIASAKTSLADSVSINETTSNAMDGSATHRSLPRNWSKQYASVQQRRSAPSNGPEEKAASTASAQMLESVPSEEHDEEIAALQQAVAVTALRVIQIAVDQYEAVVRMIEHPRTPHLGKMDHSEMHGKRPLITMNQALVFLGYIVELLFQMLQQASSIGGLAGERHNDTAIEERQQIEDNDDIDTSLCFVGTLLLYLQSFVWRFSAALFATRISGLPLVHDQRRIQLLMSIAATAKSRYVRHHAAMLLSQLLAVCYDQTGSFLLIKAPILKVISAVFFSVHDKLDSTWNMPTTSLRDLLDEMRAFATTSRDNVTSLPLSFHIQFIDLLNDLTTKVHAYERWQSAFENPNVAHDFEEIEEAVDRVVEDISPHWLLEEKLVWLDALHSLHVRRERFAEAACCKVAAIECVQRARLGSGTDDLQYLARVQQWVVRELFVARSYAEQADWIEKELSICELLLVCLKQQHRYNEYQEMLRCIDALIGRLAERQESSANRRGSSAFSFYRVRYAGGCVPALIANDEFIYKRSKFMSLGEFVGDMKTMLRAKYPQCERVDVVPEPKPLTGSDNNPNVIFLRATTVEEAYPEDLSRLKAMEHRGHNWRVAFKFAVPFTVDSLSSYGKTSEQMKRITFLAVARTFPCRLNRQRVRLRYEEVRCPIENSMDDIQKRCALLRAEIDKENIGKTDLKTLTLVLKGSVDTHVHGGIPEVLDSFLAASPVQLVDAEGRAMSSRDSLSRRHELANLLVEFAQLCWQCLLISRDAFRRSNQPGLPPHFATSAPFYQPELLPHHFALGKSDVPSDNFLPPLLHRSPLTMHSMPLNQSIPAPLEIEPNFLLQEVSPLQTEFERSFASLVEQLKTKIPFAFKNAASLTRLQQQTACLRSSAAPSPSATSTAPVAPLPATDTVS
ncbi:unnamed protein product [Phytophthora lilii]|uniref:Unnamed protein product n=1 Tax=Phytophthora lilii TaxID=2077276 RepID=A0A9W6U0A6_9STRA|nr:unnamed protein product [Phytophthora lilii]